MIESARVRGKSASLLFGGTCARVQAGRQQWRRRRRRISGRLLSCDRFGARRSPFLLFSFFSARSPALVLARVNEHAAATWRRVAACARTKRAPGRRNQKAMPRAPRLRAPIAVRNFWWRRRRASYAAIDDDERRVVVCGRLAHTHKDKIARLHNDFLIARAFKRGRALAFLSKKIEQMTSRLFSRRHRLQAISSN